MLTVQEYFQGLATLAVEIIVAVGALRLAYVLIRSYHKHRAR